MSYKYLPFSFISYKGNIKNKITLNFSIDQTFSFCSLKKSWCRILNINT